MTRTRRRRLGLAAAILCTPLAATPIAHAEAWRTIERASVAFTGGDAGGESYGAKISDDGRYVSFASRASNLVPDDPNGSTADIFQRDLRTGRTELITANSQTPPERNTSADGRYVVVETAAGITVSDTATGTSEVMTGMGGAPLDGSSFAPAMSRNGRFVMFWSWATNIVSGDTSGGPDVFLHDRTTQTTERVSVSSSGEQSSLRGAVGAPLTRPSISDDGRFVAFQARFPLDADGQAYVRDRLTGKTELISVANDGAPAGSRSRSLSISADGRFVAFASSNLDPRGSDGTDAFVRDRVRQTTSRISVNSVGEPGGSRAAGFFRTDISADGSFVVYDTDAPGLVDGDTNNASDVFVAAIDRAAPETSVSAPAGAGSSRTVSFSSSERNSTFECRLDGSTFAACSSPYATPAVADGVHRIEVRATDSAGNTDGSSAAAEFTVDTRPPTTDFVRTPGSRIDDRTPEFRFRADESGASFACRIDGGPFSPCASPFTAAPLRGGKHTFAVRARDGAGNEDPTPATHAFTVIPSSPDFSVEAVRVSASKRPRVILVGVRYHATATVRCVKPCKGKGSARSRRQNSKRSKRLVVTLARAALREKRLEVRVAAPGRLTRYKRYATIRGKGLQLKTSGCLGTHNNPVECPT